MSAAAAIKKHYIKELYSNENKIYKYAMGRGKDIAGR
jgi:hypothetical protein